ncbi:hypothetical protein [Pseudoclavibacter terrae]|nr:hypothetical protein [Pseudoclavibacter terrae]
MNPSTPSRRTLIQAGAWSAPVMAAAFAAPAASASPCVSNTLIHTALLPTGTGVADAAGRTTTWTVPAGVTRIRYVVTGGSGGGRGITGVGGAGASVDGRLTVVPGTVLTLVVGQGGVGVPTNSTGAAQGGQGHGSGGSNALPNTSGTKFVGGSGGAGSAIRIGTTPIAIAGGGGGAGAGYIGSFTLNDFSVTYDPAPDGGAGGLSATNGSRIWTAPVKDAGRRVSSNGGRGAVGSTPGAGGAPFPNAATGLTVRSAYTQTGAGTQGGAASTAGATGGTGVALVWPSTTVQNLSGASGTVNEAGNRGGAGGGGYAGGGGGGSSVGLWDRNGANSTGGILGMASGGGGGSSWVSPTAVGGATPTGTPIIGVGANSNPAPEVRVPGSIQIFRCA